MNINSLEPLRIKLAELRMEHRDLDIAIGELEKNPFANQIQVRRLKKRKLLLKEMIAKLESQLIPDLNA